MEVRIIFYPNDKNTYITIEVIGQNERKRLLFVPKENKVVTTPKSQQDLVDRMIQFHDSSMNLLLTNQIKDNQTQCPVYHCLPGFSHPKLSNTFNLLIHKARQEKKLLIQAIAQDSLPQRKSAAIYLIGYLNNPHEIISLLTKFVRDPDDGVRNSAMRVISETMNKAKIHEIDVMPFLQLLDSPFNTDRNKALLVLLNAARSTSTKQIIIKKGNKKLVSLLRLRQPNNIERHDSSNCY
jgi:hypothetical protein